MKPKKKPRNPDFFDHSKDIMGEERFNKALEKGREAIYEIRLEQVREFLGVNTTNFKKLGETEFSITELKKDLKLSTLQKYAEDMGMKVKVKFVPEDEDDG